MTEPFLGEVKIIAFNYPPKGWAACDGQLLQINQNQALFALFGTYYGGDGRTTFALPDLRGRVASHVSGSFTIGQRGGETAHTLTNAETPMHVHQAQGTNNAGTTNIPQGQVFANANLNAYNKVLPSPQPVVAQTITPSGGGQPHQNMSPYTVLMFCVALVGIFPSQN
jgi:microcystin-dependent protein